MTDDEELAATRKAVEERRKAARLLTVVYSGEVRCPMKNHGLIALENCVSIQVAREDTCVLLRCSHVEHRERFIIEGKRSRGEQVKMPKQPGKIARGPG